MSAACSSCVRRLLPASAPAFCRAYGAKAVSSVYVRHKDVTHMAKLRPFDLSEPRLYGDHFSFNPLSLKGLKVGREATNVLTAPIPPEEIEILSTGELVASVDELVSRLNKAFGEENWNITPVNVPSNTIYLNYATMPLVEYALFVNRQFVSQCVGHGLTPLSADGLKARACLTPELRMKLTNEAKLTALQRCCKDLMIGDELSEPKFIRKWRAKNARQVEERRNKNKQLVWIRAI